MGNRMKKLRSTGRNATQISGGIRVIGFCVYLLKLFRLCSSSASKPPDATTSAPTEETTIEAAEGDGEVQSEKKKKKKKQRDEEGEDGEMDTSVAQVLVNWLIGNRRVSHFYCRREWTRVNVTVRRKRKRSESRRKRMRKTGDTSAIIVAVKFVLLTNFNYDKIFKTKFLRSLYTFTHGT